MIKTVDVEIQAGDPSMPLFPWRAFQGSPSSLRIRNVPRRIGEWVIDSVYVQVNYPDNSIQSAECKLIGGVWVGTVAGSTRGGTSENGYAVLANGKDENGNAVNGYVLGRGDVEILKYDGKVDPATISHYVNLLEDGDVENHNDGDLWKDAETGAWLIWQDGQAWAVGDDTGLIDELKERVDALDSTTSELSVAVADLNASMEGVGERLDAIDSTVSELQANVQTFENELDTKADVSALGSYVTKSEVTPYAVRQGWASTAYQANYAFMLQEANSCGFQSDFDKDKKLEVTPSKTVELVLTPYKSWFVSQWGETTFDEPVELTWQYISQVAYKVAHRQRILSIMSQAWYGTSASGIRFILLATKQGGATYDVEGTLYVLTPELALETHTVTTSVDGLSIATVDGEANIITCTRESFGRESIQKPLAFEEDLTSLANTVDEIDSSLSQVSANVETLGTRIGAAETSIGSLNTNINALGVSVANLNASMSSVSASVTSLSNTKADKVKVEPILDYMTVPISIQPFGSVDSSLQLNSTLMQQDTQKRVWWYADKAVEPPDDSNYYIKAWVVYNPTDDSFVAYKEDYTYIFDVTFPPQDADRSAINGIDNGTPRTDGRPATGYDYWWEYFEDDPRPQVSIFNATKGMYGSEQIRVKPDTQTWNVVYEDKLVEEYAPLQKFVSYEGDVLVPNQIDSAWVSMSPDMPRLGLNASYMSQDTQKRVWWSAELSYEPEPQTTLYRYVVACYDATNDTFKANIWRDEQSGLPQNISDLGDTDEWGSFTRASGWASWRDFFYNAPEDEYEVSYGQHTGIELFDHTFVKARWGGLFDVVYEGELVNAYATRQYVDENIVDMKSYVDSQIGSVLTSSF